jgi:lycopene cyclase domain-containing protein
VTYTWLALVVVALTLVLDVVVLRTRLVLRRAFWTSYAIIVVFQLVVNGVLTGRRVVTYAGSAVLGSSTPSFLGHWRVAYAPVEDLLFGFALVMQTLCWWVWFGRHGPVRDRARRP